MRGGHKIHVVWLSARAPGKLGNKEERGVGLVGEHFISGRVGARVIYLWVRMQAATDRVYTSGTRNLEKKLF